MTSEDGPAFADAFSSLCGALQAVKLLREQPTIGQDYWAVLRPFSMAEVQSGFRLARQEWEGMRFPLPAQLKHFVERARQEMQATKGSSTSVADCGQCTGYPWDVRECPGFDPQAAVNAAGYHRCPRTFKHASHTYAVRCRCWTDRYPRQEA